jgi:hypothetical protein
MYHRVGMYAHESTVYQFHSICHCGQLWELGRSGPVRTLILQLLPGPPMLMLIPVLDDMAPEVVGVPIATPVEVISM